MVPTLADVRSFLVSVGFSDPSAGTLEQMLANILSGNAPGGWDAWWANAQLVAAGLGPSVEVFPVVDPVMPGGLITDNVLLDNVIGGDGVTTPPGPFQDPADVFDAGLLGATTIDGFAAQALFVGAGLAALARFLPAIGGALLRFGRARTLRFAPNWQVAAGAEAADLTFPGVDLPSPSDIPEAIWNLARTVFIDIPAGVASPFFGFGGGAAGGPPGVGPGLVVVNSWTANGIPFFQMSDGFTWVRRKNGTWKRFKQPKPIVLMPGGAGNLRTLLRAVGVTSRQLKRINKAITSAGVRPRTRRSQPKVLALPPHPGVVQISND